jgi:cytochrome c553
MKVKCIATLLISVPLAACSADLRRGEELAQAQCASCHGKDFVTSVDPSFPKLAGQYADYLERSLRDYQTGSRNNAIMAGIAKPLSREDIRNVSAYLSRLPGPLDNRQR